MLVPFPIVVLVSVEVPESLERGCPQADREEASDDHRVVIVIEIVVIGEETPVRERIWSSRSSCLSVVPGNGLLLPLKEVDVGANIIFSSISPGKNNIGCWLRLVRNVLSQPHVNDWEPKVDLGPSQMEHVEDTTVVAPDLVNGPKQPSECADDHYKP